MTARPMPPPDMVDDVDELFVPSSDLIMWARDTFILPSALLHNEDHAHLEFVEIGMLWTNVGNSRGGNRIVGQCELGRPQAMGKWAKARAELQVREWFGDIPDFIITLDAGYAAGCDDDTFCALVEHELYHAGQELDLFGAPKFKMDGSPKFGIKGHDVEEFVGVVERYGVGAAAGRTAALVDAASRAPSIAQVNIAHACGTCRS